MTNSSALFVPKLKNKRNVLVEQRTATLICTLVLLKIEIVKQLLYSSYFIEWTAIKNFDE